jgi:hypothetical protein
MSEIYNCSLDLSEYELNITFGIKGDPEYIEEFLTERTLNQIAGRLGQPTWELLKKKINDEVKNNICKHC